MKTKDFKTTLVSLMRYKGLTQAELARRSGITPSSLSDWITGKYEPKQDKILILADALGVPARVLLGYGPGVEDYLESITPDYDGPAVSLDDAFDGVTVRLMAEAAAIKIDVYQAASCGCGVFVADEVVDVISLPSELFKNPNGDYFAQYAEGDSMIGAGIYDGDLLVFEKANRLENGQIGCFCVGENVATCKKFSMSANHEIYLIPANDKYSPIAVNFETENFRIVGRLVIKISKEG